MLGLAAKCACISFLLHCRNDTTATNAITFQVNGIYLQTLSESAMIIIATREDSQFNFTIKVCMYLWMCGRCVFWERCSLAGCWVHMNIIPNARAVQCMLLAAQVQHDLIPDSEGGSPSQGVIISFSAMDNLTSPVLPVQLQTVLLPNTSLLGTLDLRAVFQQSHLFSDSKTKDLNIWKVEVYYRMLDLNGSFAWQLLPSHLPTADARPGDDLQQILDQSPPHTELVLAPGEYHQSLLISKPVSIMSSEGANRTIIHGHVTIRSDNVTLVGLTFHPVNGSAVVRTSHANTAIYNSIISSKDGKIPSDTTKNVSGITCAQCRGLSIRNTLINGMTEGVSLTSSRDVVIVNSVISSCNKGLVIRHSSNGLVCQSLFQNNQLANKQDNKSSISFQDNHFNRNLHSFNRDVRQNGSTLTGPPPIMDDRRGFPTPPFRLPKPTVPSPFGSQPPTPTTPTHAVNTQAPTSQHIGSLQVSMSCDGVGRQQLSGVTSKLASRPLDTATCAGMLGSVLLVVDSTAPQTGESTLL